MENLHFFKHLLLGILLFIAGLPALDAMDTLAQSTAQDSAFNSLKEAAQSNFLGNIAIQDIEEAERAFTDLLTTQEPEQREDESDTAFARRFMKKPYQRGLLEKDLWERPFLCLLVFAHNCKKKVLFKNLIIFHLALNYHGDSTAQAETLNNKYINLLHTLNLEDRPFQESSPINPQEASEALNQTPSIVDVYQDNINLVNELITIIEAARREQYASMC